MLAVKRLLPSAILPTRAYSADAGLDLYAAVSGTIQPGQRSLISTGIAIALDLGKVGLIWPRSGLAVNAGVDVGAGVIDAGYRGEINVLLFNHGPDEVTINAGDKIAQLIIQSVWLDFVQEVDTLKGTQRGTKGFGSSDI